MDSQPQMKTSAPSRARLEEYYTSRACGYHRPDLPFSLCARHKHPTPARAKVEMAVSILAKAASYLCTERFLNVDDRHQFLDCVGALLQGGLLFRGELDFDDLFQAIGTQLARHADK